MGSKSDPQDTLEQLTETQAVLEDFELAESYSYRYRDIEMIKRLLVGPDGKPFDKVELDRLLRTQVFVDVARIACFRIIKLMLALPSWIERPASEPS